VLKGNGKKESPGETIREEESETIVSSEAPRKRLKAVAEGWSDAKLSSDPHSVISSTSGKKSELSSPRRGQTSKTPSDTARENKGRMAAFREERSSTQVVKRNPEQEETPRNANLSYWVERTSSDRT